MKRLYLSIYLALIGHLVLFGAIAATVWMWHDEDDRRRHIRGLAETIQEALPPADAPAAELGAALERLRERFDVDLAVRDATGRILAKAGRALARRPGHDAATGWSRADAQSGRRGWAFTVQLPDGRSFAASRAHDRGPRFLVSIAAFLLLLAAVAHPVARRITRRLERLQARVDQLAEGDLQARVDVEGRDEVARLATSFNRAAERIEKLVGAQRTMLAAASHELRSPLARIRMAVELLEREPTPALCGQIARDIDELDDLIDELLLASRLEASQDLGEIESVDVLALAAEEAVRAAAKVGGEPVEIRGSRRLLRHLVRNLLQNAARHGSPPVGVHVARRGDEAVLAVSDRGPGIPPDQRDAIFRPFHRPPGAAERGDGVGLGLAIVREIARRHGGDATCLCLDEPGGGTRIEVRLAGAPATAAGRNDPPEAAV